MKKVPRDKKGRYTKPQKLNKLLKDDYLYYKIHGYLFILMWIVFLFLLFWLTIV